MYGCGVCVEDVWRRVGVGCVESVWCVGVARVKGVWCVEVCGCSEGEGFWYTGVHVYRVCRQVCVCIVHVVCAVRVCVSVW